jgi:hypothetical protein
VDNPSRPDPTTSVSQARIDQIIESAHETATSLVILEGLEVGRRFQLGEQPVIAGRDPHAGIVVVDSEVSRLHCLLIVIDGVVIVEDLGSTNGTYVNGKRVAPRATLPLDGLLRIGGHTLRCERCTSYDLERADDQQRDLKRATNYVLSLLPPVLSAGPVRTEWMLLPSARLGGDAFGYEQLDPHTYALYLIDVSGHGVSAAIHSVSILNVLRQHALPQTDFTDPACVLTQLNAAFQMERYYDQCFTMWYGVYDARTRTLTYASAGHHPAYLVPHSRSRAEPLRTPGLVIGAWPTSRYESAKVVVVPGSMLYLFSDGVFEVTTDAGRWRLADLVPVLLQPARGGEECRRIHHAVRAASRPGALDDDFSLLVVTFP